MAHPDKALTAVRAKNVTIAGRYADGNGLYLVVDPSRAKRWILRTVVQGRRRDIGLGSLKLVSLAEAREKALAYRKIARDGGDPMTEARKAPMPTFAEAADAVHAEHSVAWRNKKHIDQWISTLRAYAIPVIGSSRVDQIDSPDVLRVLSPIWMTKPETARRVRQQIGTVMDWAKAAGHREGENPIDGVLKGLPKQPNNKKHHAAMPYNRVPAFVQRLQAEPGLPALALELLVLTATRTNEVLRATWDEIDVASGLWTIPAARMKANRDHRVPLSSRSLDIVRQSKQLCAGSRYVFPSRNSSQPLSNMALLMMMRRMGEVVTVHGFRSAFRDWAAERTNFSREVCEMALAHTIKDKAEAAYRRGDLMEKRRLLMVAWGQFISKGLSTVVQLERA